MSQHLLKNIEFCCQKHGWKKGQHFFVVTGLGKYVTTTIRNSFILIILLLYLLLVLNQEKQIQTFIFCFPSSEYLTFHWVVLSWVLIHCVVYRPVFFYGKNFSGFSVIEVTGWIPRHTGKQWLLCSLCWITEQGEGGRKCILSSPQFVSLACVAFSSLPHVWNLFRDEAAFAMQRHQLILHVELLPDTNSSRRPLALFLTEIVQKSDFR